MNAYDVYEKYIIKSEKNSTNDYFSTDKEKFTFLYNELSLRVLKFYTNNRGINSRKEIQNLLVDNKNLTKINSNNEEEDYKLPDDFFDWASIKATASKGKCLNKDIELYEINNEDRNRVLHNEFLKPSFNYREAPYTYVSNNIKVFVEEGMTTDLYLTYYKKPKRIKMIDPDYPEGQFQDVNIELKESVVDRIVSAMVGDFKINNEDSTFQMDKLRQNENISPLGGK